MKFKRGTKELAITATALIASCITLNVDAKLAIVGIGIYAFLFIYDKRFRGMF